MESFSPISPADAAHSTGGASDAAGQRLNELAKLLSDLDDAPRPSRGIPLKLTPTQENALVQVRLGIASSLYTALKWKHEPTARHCLRVALGCSAWVHRMGLPSGTTRRNRSGRAVARRRQDRRARTISSPSPARCRRKRRPSMDGHWLVGPGDSPCRCCASKSLQDLLLYTPAWFDGSKLGLGILGEAIAAGLAHRGDYGRL